MSKTDKIFSWISANGPIFYAKFKEYKSQCSIRNILTIDAFLKILFLYSTTILCVILFDFDFSSTIFKKNSKHTIAIYSVRGRIGEHQAYIRTLRALKNLKWDYVGCAFNETFTNYFLTRHFYSSAASIINRIVKPEVNIALTHYVRVVPYGYNMAYLNVPDYMLYNLKGKFLDNHEHLKSYDAYIDLYSVVNEENKMLKRVLHYYGKRDAPIIPAYLAQNYEKFSAPTSYNSIVITGSVWGCNRGSFRMKDAINRLGKEKLLVAYGLDEELDFLGGAYKGFAEDYGDPTDSIIVLQRKSGLSLVVHNLEHLLAGLPTSRIGEAIMSGALVINDNHPFISKFFGDSVLYFDSFKTSDDIYDQFKLHIAWAQAHPEEAKKKAQKAYDIFVKDWTIEKQLEKIINHVNK